MQLLSYTPTAATAAMQPAPNLAAATDRCSSLASATTVALKAMQPVLAWFLFKGALEFASQKLLLIPTAMHHQEQSHWMTQVMLC
jgi:hypothetical protein